MSARYLGVLVNLIFGLALGVLVVAGGILVVAPLTGEPLLSQWPVLTSQPPPTWGASAGGIHATLALGHGELSVEHSGFGYPWVLRVVDLVISGTLLLTGLWLLRRFTGDVSQGVPFSSGSARRLHWVGLILMAFPLWQILRDTLWHGLLATQISHLGQALATPFQTPAIDAFQLQYSIDWGFAASGVVMLVVAEAFRVGVLLRQENEEII